MRLTKDNWYINICKAIAKRSTCTRKNIGAIIVKDGRILCTGYNGAPSGDPHCLDTGCTRPKEDYEGINYVKCKAIHAEQNAILQAAKYGIKIKGATLYSTHAPCEICKKLIKGSGLRGYNYIENNKVQKRVYVNNIIG